MKLYLVRHGEVNHNLYSLHNREDEDLNETGIKQAKELRKKIKKIEYDFIISQVQFMNSIIYSTFCLPEFI